MSRRIVVTGGSRGIGRAIVERFAGADDTEVVAVGRDLGALAEVEAAAANVRGVRCDVTDEGAVVAMFDALGAVDVLVNNAGISDSAPLHRTSRASWDAQMAVNATAVFLCTRAVIDGMLARDDGRIVTVASTGGRVGVAYAAAYAASKHAALGLMRSAAAELAGTRVTANAVCPAFVDTGMTGRSAARIAQTHGSFGTGEHRRAGESRPARAPGQARGGGRSGRLAGVARRSGDQRSDPGTRRRRNTDMSPFRASPPLTEEWRHFEFAVADGVARITLNRPDKLNPLTFESYADLRDLFAELPLRGDARAVVITGRGRGFCSGGDVEEIIGELQHMGAAQLLEFTRMTGQMIKAIRDCPLPVIAAVNGVAAGAGSVVALASDFRLLSENASFAFLFTRVGLSGADMGAAYLLPRVVGLGRATELLMLGDRVSAERAVAIGLASEVVAADELLDRADALARRLADGPALAYATTKTLISRELDMDLASAVELEASTQALLMLSNDHREFYEAWSQKRPPAWQGS